MGHRVSVLIDHKPFLDLTDHKLILDLFKKCGFTNNLKFNHWFISVLQFAPKFKYILGQLNTFTDSLSRVHEESEKTPST